jgi:hypothetical protein
MPTTDPFARVRAVNQLITAVTQWREGGSVAIGLLVAAEQLVQDDECARVVFARQLIATAQRLDPDAVPSPPRVLQ